MSETISIEQFDAPQVDLDLAENEAATTEEVQSARPAVAMGRLACASCPFANGCLKRELIGGAEDCPRAELESAEAQQDLMPKASYLDELMDEETEMVVATLVPLVQETQPVETPHFSPPEKAAADKSERDTFGVDKAGGGAAESNLEVDVSELPAESKTAATFTPAVETIDQIDEVKTSVSTESSEIGQPEDAQPVVLEPELMVEDKTVETTQTNYDTPRVDVAKKPDLQISSPAVEPLIETKTVAPKNVVINDTPGLENLDTEKSLEERPNKSDATIEPVRSATELPLDKNIAVVERYHRKAVELSEIVSSPSESVEIDEVGVVDEMDVTIINEPDVEPAIEAESALSLVEILPEPSTVVVDTKSGFERELIAQESDDLVTNEVGADLEKQPQVDMARPKMDEPTVVVDVAECNDDNVLLVPRHGDKVDRELSAENEPVDELFLPTTNVELDRQKIDIIVENTTEISEVEPEKIDEIISDNQPEKEATSKGYGASFLAQLVGVVAVFVAIQRRLAKQI